MPEESYLDSICDCLDRTRRRIEHVRNGKMEHGELWAGIEDEVRRIALQIELADADLNAEDGTADDIEPAPEPLASEQRP